MLHPQQVGARGAKASIPLAPPQLVSCRACFAAMANRPKAALAVGLSYLFFSGMAAKPSAVFSAVRGHWLRFAHAAGVLGCSFVNYARSSRLLRFWDWVDSSGSGKSVLRSTGSAPALLAAVPVAYPSKAQTVMFYSIGRALWSASLLPSRSAPDCAA